MDVREAYLHLFSLCEKLDAADLQGYWASLRDRAASSAEDYSGGICGPRSRCNVVSQRRFISSQATRRARSVACSFDDIAVLRHRGRCV
ncbi:hypothetical protein C8034_v006146 [Colletotrichum sidae]|uniref:Uncharacterized protein n=1 Tax=Colletotrichum sidae TaxID=1347389 RepID=A0A4R8T5M8_9PEZI|nr:hypothetical protein C8034_v006146 [Colletotrichum sidae]